MRMITIALALIALVVVGLAFFAAHLRNQSSDTAAAIARDFLKASAPDAQLRDLRVRHTPGDDSLYSVELSYTPGQSAVKRVPERVELQVETELGYVTRARWRDRGSRLTPVESPDRDSLRKRAESFLGTHCVFWTDEFEMQREDLLPRGKSSAYMASWTAETSQAHIRVALSLITATGDAFSYSCHYVPAEDIKQPTVTRADAFRTARKLLDERYGNTATITEVSFHDHMKKYDAPIWLLDFRVDEEGMETWYDSVFIDAVTGEVLYPD